MNPHDDRKDVSVKFLDIDEFKIEARLVNIGAHKLFNRVLSKTLIFDHQTLRLRQEGKILRLRQVGNKVFLSIKAGQSPLAHDPYHKVQDSELLVDDFTLAFKLLESLGFEAFRYQEKMRTGYELKKGGRAEINEYPKIAPFIEIEAPSDEILKEIVESLGLNMADAVKMSPTEILRHYGLRDIGVIKFVKEGETT